VLTITQHEKVKIESAFVLEELKTDFKTKIEMQTNDTKVKFLL
jgi:hypothetical protein